MRGRSPRGAALLGERLRELPNARRIFAAIERRLDDLPRQCAPRPRPLLPALGSRREIQADPLDPLPVRHRIETRQDRELPIRDLAPAPRPFQGVFRDSPQLGVRNLVLRRLLAELATDRRHLPRDLRKIPRQLRVAVGIGREHAVAVAAGDHAAMDLDPSSIEKAQAISPELDVSLPSQIREPRIDPRSSGLSPPALLLALILAPAVGFEREIAPVLLGFDGNPDACRARQAVEAGQLLQAVADRLAGRTGEQLIVHPPIGCGIYAPVQPCHASQIAGQPIELQAREPCRDRIGRALLERHPQLPVVGVGEGRGARVLLVAEEPESPQAPAGVLQHRGPRQQAALHEISENLRSLPGRPVRAPPAAVDVHKGRAQADDILLGALPAIEAVDRREGVLAEVRLVVLEPPIEPLRGGRALPPWAPAPHPKPGSRLVPRHLYTENRHRLWITHPEEPMRPEINRVVQEQPSSGEHFGPLA